MVDLEIVFYPITSFFSLGTLWPLIKSRIQIDDAIVTTKTIDDMHKYISMYPEPESECQTETKNFNQET